MYLRGLRGEKWCLLVLIRGFKFSAEFVCFWAGTTGRIQYGFGSLLDERESVAKAP